MRKDFKTGMLFGLGLSLAVVFWLSSSESFSIKTQVLNSSINPDSEAPSENDVRYSTALPDYTGNSGNIKISKDNNSSGQAHQITPLEGKERIHIVKRDETLTSISYQYYGSNQWKKIYNANKARIKNPDVVLPGTRLVIPD